MEALQEKLKGVGMFQNLMVGLILCVFGVNPLSAQESWKTFSNTREVSMITVTPGGEIWAATTGGVLKIIPAIGGVTAFTNTAGLSTLNARSIKSDNAGNLLTGLNNGDFFLFDRSSARWINKASLGSIIINDIAVSAETVILGSTAGVSRLDPVSYELTETALKLGLFSPEIEVTSVAVDGQFIWAATAEGIARTEVDQENIQAPSAWTNFTVQGGLPSNDVVSVANSGLGLFASTIVGITMWDGIDWNDMNAGLAEFGQQLTSNLNLYAYSKSRIYRFDSGTSSWTNLGLPLVDDSGVSFNIASFREDDNGVFWVGSQKNSVLMWDGATWIRLQAAGPGGNGFEDLCLDEEGGLWCMGRPDGVYRLKGNDWENIRSIGGFNLARGGTSGPWRCAVGAGSAWIGDWGSGLVEIDFSGEVMELGITIDETNGLTGFSGDEGFPVVAGLFLDGDYLWITLHDPFDEQKALTAYNTLTGEFTYFSSAGYLLSTNLPGRSMLKDRFGRLWVATGIYNRGQQTSGNAVGVVVVDFNGTVANQADDEASSFLNMSDGLFSDYVLSLAEDQNGTIWIGTDQGLNSYDPFQGVVTSYFSPNAPKGALINDIAIDQFNNKWFATAGGVSVLNNDGEWKSYSAPADPLVDNNVESIAIDNDSGYVYFGTLNGISRLESPFFSKADGSSVKVYPSPFVIGEHDLLNITNIPPSSQVKIFDLSGRLVTTIRNASGFSTEVQWDGRNDDGKNVRTGVYLYHIYPDATSDFSSITGKLVVIRR